MSGSISSAFRAICGPNSSPSSIMPEYMLLPRLAAIAEVGWSYDRKDYPDFYRRMASLRKQYDINGYDYGKHMFAADSAATAPAGR